LNSKIKRKESKIKKKGKGKKSLKIQTKELHYIKIILME
jgi:hypothetical protein